MVEQAIMEKLRLKKMLLKASIHNVTHFAALRDSGIVLGSIIFCSHKYSYVKLFHWSQETLEVNELYVFVFPLPGGLACKLQRKFNMVFVLKVSIIFSGNKQFKKFTSSMRKTNHS